MTDIEPSRDADDTTGLPLLRTWAAVYTVVLAAFLVMLALLIVLTLSYP